MRWKGSGKLKKEKYMLYFYCNDKTSGARGTGFMVMESHINRWQVMRNNNKRLI